MNDKAEKVYGEAFFELCMEECSDKAGDILAELEALDGIFSDNAELVKLMGTPTIPTAEKVQLVKDIVTSGGISELCGNLLCVLAERSRFDCFNGIVKRFRSMYNEHFKIAEILVTTSSPLTEKQRADVEKKMSEVTGKKISIKEKIDESIIGGIIIDYGTTRYDGSVRTRLNALAGDLSSIID